MALRASLLSFALLSLSFFALAACSNSGGIVTPTATPSATPIPDPLTTWLTADRQQLLLDTLKQLAPDTGWVAGCVYQTKEDQNVFNKIKKPAGRAFYSEFTNPALGQALAARVEGSTVGSGEFVGFAPDAATYCYVPKP
jgi:hypothetical protein